ncbi:MAG: hypothetical protein Q8Q60_05510 [Candidatus Chromulinivorax sp.]|nr:hypothetical protein [Candidatus Chromulinivorax sp.]
MMNYKKTMIYTVLIASMFVANNVQAVMQRTNIVCENNQFEVTLVESAAVQSTRSEPKSLWQYGLDMTKIGYESTSKIAAQGYNVAQTAVAKGYQLAKIGLSQGYESAQTVAVKEFNNFTTEYPYVIPFVGGGAVLTAVGSIACRYGQYQVMQSVQQLAILVTLYQLHAYCQTKYHDARQQAVSSEEPSAEQNQVEEQLPVAQLSTDGYLYPQAEAEYAAELNPPAYNPDYREER